ncbi:MAG TPA: alpha/beta fold hydrolase [Acidimicrobiales bacterium]|nr:alpha/beta fold hydrolase [Acidimicrobiales bacterium]
MRNIEAFTVEFGDAAIADLRDRLRRTRWPERETVTDWSQGVPLAYVQEICNYWADEYDFDAAQQRLNAHPNYCAEVDGLDIHFVHVRSRHADAIPLVLSHGWPGSFVEFLGVVDALVDPPDPVDAFDVVVPSLPGYGFSGRPTETGWDVTRIARAFDELMSELGYDRYAAQGGDWGAMVTHELAQRHSDRVVAIHTNMPFVPFDAMDTTNMTADEQAGLDSMDRHRKTGRGYSEQQSTRPQTLGYGLTDSPAGQCAWIVEKFWAWTDCDGHPEHALTKDQMLDNICVYWFGATGASSARLYWESLRQANRAPVTVPTGISNFPKEIFPISRRWAETRYLDLRYFNRLDKGGHFAAFEQPALFVDELRSFFRLLRSEGRR